MSSFPMHTTTPFPITTTLRRAFADHLNLVSAAMFTIHKHDAGLAFAVEEAERIRACLSPALTLQHAVEDARRVLRRLEEELGRVQADE